MRRVCARGEEDTHVPHAEQNFSELGPHLHERVEVATVKVGTERLEIRRAKVNVLPRVTGGWFGRGRSGGRLVGWLMVVVEQHRHTRNNKVGQVSR